MDFLGLPMAPSVTGEERDAELSFKGNEKCRQLVSSPRPDPQAFLLPDGSGTEGQERPQNALKTPSKRPPASSGRDGRWGCSIQLQVLQVGREQGPGREPPSSEARCSLLPLPVRSCSPPRPGATLAGTRLAPSLTMKNTWLMVS